MQCSKEETFDITEKGMTAESTKSSMSFTDTKKAVPYGTAFFCICLISMSVGSNLSRSFNRDDTHLFAATAIAFELDMPVGCREERIIASTGNIPAGMKFRAALLENDRAGSDEFAAVLLDPKHLGL